MDPVAQIGATAPEFELLDLDGHKHALRDGRGSIVILNFWSAECTHSARADEIMHEFVEAWGKAAILWCIAPNENESNELIRSVANTNKVGRLLRDEGQGVADMYGAVTTPHMFVIDAEGVLRYAGGMDDVSLHQRTATRNYVNEAVSAVLNGHSPDPSETTPFGCAIIRHAV